MLPHKEAQIVKKKIKWDRQEVLFLRCHEVEWWICQCWYFSNIHAGPKRKNATASNTPKQGSQTEEKKKIKEIDEKFYSSNVMK